MMIRFSRSDGGPVIWIGWTDGSGNGLGALTGAAWQTSGAFATAALLTAAAVDDQCTAPSSPTNRATDAAREIGRRIGTSSQNDDDVRTGIGLSQVGSGTIAGSDLLFD